MAYNILIVDDSAVTREVMARTCKLSGIELGEVFKAAHGGEALALLNEHWVDLILTDINMPVMDGMQLVEELSRRDGLRSIPVVIVSTEGSRTRMDELSQKGIRAYIRKPFTPEQIAAVMQEVLGVEYEQ